MTDLELLGQYGRTKEQAAFEELVRRHVDWVYSAALRQVRDRQLAEDVTQAVFIVLARRAGSLHGKKPLSSWLMTVTRCAAINAVRAEARRKRHEREAAALRQESSEAQRQAEWEAIAPVLDEQVLRLKQKDRDAVMLRFYERRSFAEVGETLGISEEAARKRVDRAVEQLRERMIGKGVTIGAGSLAVVVSERLVEQAPAELMRSVATGGGAATGAGVIAKGALNMMTWMKVKVAAVVVAGLAVAGVGVGVAGMAGGGASTRPAAATAPTASTQPTAIVAPAANPQVRSVQVLLPDGTPAAGAEVYLARAGRDSLFLDDPVSRLGQRGPTSRPTPEMVTGADGRFALPAGEQRPMMVIVDEEGVAEMVPEDLDSDRVTLQAWGQIQGQFSPALRTGAGQKARYFSNHMGLDGFQLVYTIDTPVDGEGRFVFERVPPGNGVVSRVMPLTRGRTSMEFGEHGVRFEVGAGEGAAVSVGGIGANVRGHVEPPPGSTWRLADTFAYVQLGAMPQRKGPALPTLPTDFAKMDIAQQKAWLRQWAKTAEGKAWTAEYRAYTAAGAVAYANGIRGDGVFDLVEVPPGKYQMTIMVSEANDGPAWGLGKGLGWLSQEVVVPKGDAGQVVDLGRFVLEAPRQAGR